MLALLHRASSCLGGRRWVSISAMILASCIPATVSGQSEHHEPRSGAYAGLGVGNAWLDVSTSDALSGQPALAAKLRLGIAASDQWLVGVQSSAWLDAGTGSRVSLTSLLGVVTVYPRNDRALFIQGGLGVVALDADEPGSPRFLASGLGGSVGAGYDISLGRSFALAPYVDVVVGDFTGGTATLVHLGLSIVRY